LEITSGSICAIVGPSGSGKSTLLSIVAGLIKPQQGAVEFIQPGDPNQEYYPKASMMFQEPALLPWRTVAENIALPLELSSEKTRDLQTVQSAVDFGRLQGFEKFYPHEIPGGMQSRVAVARALITSPSLLLLDEPLGNIDENMARDLLVRLSDWAFKHGTTIVMATHSLEQAVFLADRVIVLSMSPGRLEGTVDVTFPKPRTAELFEDVAFFEALMSVRRRMKKVE
jgi:NitT/TauT family transport system ATP-binding protein